MFHARFVFSSALALVTLAACESHQAGEGCWSDFECQSNSCTFGTCDSDLAGLLGLAADVVGTASRASSPPPESPAPVYSTASVCSGLSAAACSQTTGCSLDEYCLPPFRCGDAADAGLDCFQCLYTSGCPDPCQSFPYCR